MLSVLKVCARCTPLLFIGIATLFQLSLAATIDQNFSNGACHSEATLVHPENGSTPPLNGPFVCDDQGKTVFVSISDVYANGFRITHVFERKTKNNEMTMSIIVEKKAA